MAEIRHLVKVRGRLINKAWRYSAESKRTMDHIVYMATAHRGIEENQQPGCWKQLLSTVVMVQSVCVISFFSFCRNTKKQPHTMSITLATNNLAPADAQNGFHSKSITLKKSRKSRKSNPSFLAASSALRLVGELQSFLPPSSYSYWRFDLFQGFMQNLTNVGQCSESLCETDGLENQPFVMSSRAVTYNSHLSWRSDNTSM